MGGLSSQGYNKRLAGCLGSLILLLDSSSAACFSQRYPKYLQTMSNKEDSFYQALETSAALNAIFAGGRVAQGSTTTSLLTNQRPANSYLPVIVRLNATTNFYDWRMVYHAPAYTSLQRVICLQLASDDSTKLAVAAMIEDGVTRFQGDFQTYLFVVDTATGVHVGKAAQFIHGNADLKGFTVQPQGMIMQGGIIYSAFHAVFDYSWSQNGWTTGNCNTQMKRNTKMRVGSYDWLKNSIPFYTESKQFGKSAALLLTNMTPNPIWVSGLTLVDYVNAKWMLTLFQLNEFTGNSVKTLRMSIPAFQALDPPPYIKFFGYDSYQDLFFGVYELMNYENPGTSARVGIWNCNSINSVAEARSFEGSNSIGSYNSNNILIGMRPQIEIINGKNHLHIIQLEKGTRRFYYCVIPFDKDVPQINMYPIHYEMDFPAVAKWLEPSTETFQLVNEPQLAFNSWTAGKWSGRNSGMIMPTILTPAKSCHNDSVSPYARCYPTDPKLVLKLVYYSSASALSTLNIDNTYSAFSTFTPSSPDPDFCIGTTAPSQVTNIAMSSWGTQSELWEEDLTCNPKKTFTITPGSMVGSGPFYHTIGTVPSSFAFTPPTISDPTCETNAWDYQLKPDANAFANRTKLVLSVNNQTKTITVATLPDATNSYSPLAHGQTYTVTVRCHLPDLHVSEFTFIFTLQSLICTFTAPVVPNQSYTLGDLAFTFTAPDCTVSCTPTTPVLAYTNTVIPGAAFINGNSGVGKTFTWATSNPADAGTYVISIRAAAGGNFQDYIFSLTIPAATCSMTPPATISDQYYLVGDPNFTFYAPGVTTTCTNVTYTSIWVPYSNFIQANGDGKSFGWGTIDGTFAGMTYTFTITARNGVYSVSYQFKLNVSCVITPPTISDQIYLVGQSSVTFLAPNVTTTCTGVTYTSTVDAAATSFVYVISDKTFTWYTNDFSLAGVSRISYVIYIQAKAAGIVADYKFNLIVQLPVCSVPMTFAAPASQTNPPIYRYETTPARFTFTPYTIIPINCAISYSCSSIPIDLCAASDGSSTFDPNTAAFTFMSQDAITYPPGVYTFAIVVTAGSASQTASFQLTIEYPPLVLLPSPFSDQTRQMGEAAKELAFEVNTMVQPINLLNPGRVMVAFRMSDQITMLDQTIFGVTSDSAGSAVSPFVLKQVTDSLKVGRYSVLYKVWYENYPNLVAFSSAFTIRLDDPCLKAQIKFLPNQFPTFNYLIGDLEAPFLSYRWNDSLLGTTLPQCGDFQITKFYTFSGGNATPLDTAVFQVNLNAREFTVKTNNFEKTGTYLIYYEVILAKYPLLVHKVDYPFQVTITRPSLSAEPADDTTQPEEVNEEDQADAPAATKPVISVVQESNDAKTPTMKISEISIYGLLIVKFDQDMIIPANWTSLNETALDIWITLANSKLRGNRLLAEYDAKENLNFTWNVTNFAKRQMAIQLYFEEAYYVTPLNQMHINVKQREVFRAQATQLMIDEDKLETWTICRPQVQIGSDLEVRTVQQLAQTVQSGTKTALAITFVMNVLLSVALSLLWNMINGMQILSLLPMTDVDMPANAWIILSQIYYLASFSVINVDGGTDAFSRFFNLKDSQKGVSQQMQIMSFQSTNVIKNLGLLFFFLLLFIVFLLLLLIAKIFTKFEWRYRQRLQNAYESLAKKLFWNALIRIFIEVYIDQAFIQGLRLRDPMFVPWTEGVSTVIAGITILSLVVFPIVCWIALVRNKHSLQKEEIKSKYEAAYEGVNTKNFMALGYTSVFMFKRLLFASFVLFISNNILQAFLIFGLLGSGAAYILIAKPQVERTARNQETFNDILVYVLSYYLIIFSDFVTDKKAKYKMGWAVVALVAFCVFINVSILVYSTYAGSRVKLKVAFAKLTRKCKLCIKKTPDVPNADAQQVPIIEPKAGRDERSRQQVSSSSMLEDSVVSSSISLELSSSIVQEEDIEQDKNGILLRRQKVVRNQLNQSSNHEKPLEIIEECEQDSFGSDLEDNQNAKQDQPENAQEHILLPETADQANTNIQAVFMHLDKNDQEETKQFEQKELQFESPRDEHARDQMIQVKVQEAMQTFERMSGFLQKRRMQVQKTKIYAEIQANALKSLINTDRPRLFDSVELAAEIAGDSTAQGRTAAKDLESAQDNTLRSIAEGVSRPRLPLVTGPPQQVAADASSLARFKASNVNGSNTPEIVQAKPSFEEAKTSMMHERPTTIAKTKPAMVTTAYQYVSPYLLKHFDDSLRQFKKRQEQPSSINKYI